MVNINYTDLNKRSVRGGEGPFSLLHLWNCCATEGHFYLLSTILFSEGEGRMFQSFLIDICVRIFEEKYSFQVHVKC